MLNNFRKVKYEICQFDTSSNYGMQYGINILLGEVDYIDEKLFSTVSKGVIVSKFEEEELLSRLFCKYNLDDGDYNHRSLSPGDIIKLKFEDKTVKDFLCMPIGWKSLN